MVDEELLEAATHFFLRSFDGVIRIEVLGGEFAFWVDGRPSVPTISKESPEGVTTRFCLWRIDYPDLSRLLSDGVQRLSSSFISQRLKISGDFAVMARLDATHD